MLCFNYLIEAGERMDNQKLAKEVITTKGGIAKSADFVAAGMRSADVVNLCNSGFLERVRHGYYRLADIQEISEAQLISTLIPKGIVCVESALFHYGYSDFTPRKWSIAVPRSMSRTKLEVDELLLISSLWQQLTVQMMQNPHNTLIISPSTSHGISY